MAGDSFRQLCDTIVSRRTSKNFEGGTLEKEVIENLLELAVWAPNHRLNEPWRFRVVQSSGIQKWIAMFQQKLNRDEAQLFEKNFERLSKVATVVYVTCLKDPNELIHEENYAATSAAVQNLLLGATALGIQSYWNTGRIMTHPVTLEFLNIDSQERMVGAIWLGRGSVPEPRPRTPARDKTLWIN